MLPSLSLSLASLSLAGLVQAKVVSYNWDVTWVWANPDGAFARPVVGVNGQWPCPTIEATVGDTIEVKIVNKLVNQTTGLHFHGINHIHTPDMDGATGITGCPVPPDSSITYKFKADSPGTFWWHSHDMGQYPDGLRGPLIVHDKNDPYRKSYDEEYILTVSDWYHNSSITAVRNMLTPANTKFAPPIPDGVLVNEGLGSHLNFAKGKTYRIRVINFSAFASAMLHFDSHAMTIISNDASYLEKQEASQLRIAPAQRYDFLISATDKDTYNSPFLVSLDLNRDWTTPAGLIWPLNYTGYLVVDSSKPLDKADVVSLWEPIDEGKLKGYKGAKAYGSYDRLIELNFKFCIDQNGYPRACFNDRPYINQKVPTLYSAASTGEANENPAIYGQVNPFVVKHGEVVQIVVNNINDAAHPFHLHGHQFQVLDLPGTGAGNWPGHDGAYANTPPSRDTVTIKPNSHAVLRFKADNPGAWLFHCHIEWHVEMGLTATIIEAPEKLRGRTFPDDQIAACKKLGIPYQGNAAGNVQDPTDQTGFVTVPPTVYNGASYPAN